MWRGYTTPDLSASELNAMLGRLSTIRDAWYLNQDPKFTLNVRRTWYYDKDTEEVTFGYRYTVHFPRSLWRTLGHTATDAEILDGLVNG